MKNALFFDVFKQPVRIPFICKQVKKDYQKNTFFRLYLTTD